MRNKRESLKEKKEVLDYFIKTVKYNPNLGVGEIIEKYNMSPSSFYKKIAKLNEPLDEDKKFNLHSLRKQIINDLENIQNKDEYIPQIQRNIDSLNIPINSILNNKPQKVKVTKRNIHKLMNVTFSREPYMYFDLSTECNLLDIYDFNNEFLLKYCENDKKRKGEFINNYSISICENINGILYYISDRDYIYDNLAYISLKKIDTNLVNYRTIFFNHRKMLEEVINIKSGEVKCINSEKVKSEKYLPSIKNYDDIEDHYNESINKLLDKLTYGEVAVLKKIIDIENSNCTDKEIRKIRFEANGLIPIVIPEYKNYNKDLLNLLIKGYVYIKS